MSTQQTWRSFQNDLLLLTKFRLNVLVLVSVVAGYFFGTSVESFSWLTLLHTLLGAGAASLGAAAFNQLQEIEQDRHMERTKKRPLPDKRMPPALAFAAAWLLSAFGLLHLARFTNPPATWLTALTIATYLFAYTPLKTRSPWNTLVGAISGAIPPVIGFTAAGGAWNSYQSLFLFSILFFWQMPHFLAIGWLHAKEYQNAGFRMWSNKDPEATRTAKLSLFYASLLLLCGLFPLLWNSTQNTHLFFYPLWCIATLPTIAYSLSLKKNPLKKTARLLFFSTLWTLPILLLLINLF